VFGASDVADLRRNIAKSVREGTLYRPYSFVIRFKPSALRPASR
jgi:hypothetical protein